MGKEEWLGTHRRGASTTGGEERRRGGVWSTAGCSNEQWWPTVDLRQGNEKGRVRSGPIVDVVHERVELTR
jgi:hypothetical protein